MAGYLLTPAERRVAPIVLYPRSPDALPDLVAAHYAKARHLVPGLRYDVELTAGDPSRGRICQAGLPAPLCFTLRKEDR